MATLITKNSSTASAVPAAGDLVKGELAVNVTDKKVYTKDNSAAVVKLVGSLGNQEANAVAVTGGTINGTTIGATTPSTGAFTTASASSGFTGNLTGNVTGNVSGTAANVTGVVAIANGGTGLSALGTGVQSALGQAVTGSGSFVLSTSPSLTTPNLGTPSAAVLTNATGLPLTTGVTGTLGVANGGTGITAFGTGVATALGQNVTGSGGIVLATSPSLTTPNLGTPSAATLTNATGLPISTGVSGLGTGVATALGVATGSAGAFVVNGGALGTPSSGTVTNLTGTASININGTVGATTPTTGAFTTLSASGNITVSGGTANGVAYLNGSKVLTTGSALTFDGTTLTNTRNTTDGSAATLTLNNSGATAAYATLNLNAGSVAYQQFADAAGNAIGTAGVMFRTTSNHPLVWGINSTEQMRLTSTGLGIGTSSPNTRLHIVGLNQTNGTAEFTPNAAKGSNASYVHYGTNGDWYIRSASASGNVNIQDTGGNVGIGTGSPTQKLHVVGAIAATGQAAALTASSSFHDYIVGTNLARFAVVGDATGTAGSIVLSQYSSNGSVGRDAVTIDSSGNLGLGVTPSAWRSQERALQIGSGALHSYLSAGINLTSNAYINSSNQDIYVVNGYANRYLQAVGTGQHLWYTAASGTAGNTISFTQAMTLSAAGGLSIGTTTDAGAGNIRVNGGALIGDGTAAAPTFTFYNESNVGIFRAGAGVLGFSTAGTERARITSGGDLLVGTTTAGGVGFSLTDNAGAICTTTQRASGTGATNMCLFVNPNGTVGTIQISGTSTSYNTSSDYRLKNITGPVTNSGAYIDSLKPVEGTWKADGSTFVGLIAHEAQEVSRTTVATGTKDGEQMQGMDYSNSEFIANIIAELQSLRARVAQLEAK